MSLFACNLLYAHLRCIAQIYTEISDELYETIYSSFKQTLAGIKCVLYADAEQFVDNIQTKRLVQMIWDRPGLKLLYLFE